MMVRIVATLWSLLGAATLTAQETPPPQPDGGPLRVQVSVLLVDLIRIRDAEQSIEADLYYRIQWQDSRLADAGTESRWLDLDAIWHPKVQALTARSARDLLPREVVADADGNLSYTQRMTGTFGARTDLSEFPFDTQTLRIPLLFANQREVEFIVEEGPIVGASEELSIPDWTIEPGRLDVAPLTVSDSIPPVPGFAYVFDAQRITSYYATKVIAPLVVILMMSWTVFWAPLAQIAVQFGFAATTILTVIAYRFALANQIPPVPYGTRLDSFLNGSFVLAFLALVEVILTSRLIAADHLDRAERVDRLCRWAFPLALVVLGFYSFAL